MSLSIFVSFVPALLSLSSKYIAFYILLLIFGKTISVLIPAYGKEPLLVQVISQIPDSVDNVVLMWDQPDLKELEQIENSLGKNGKIVLNDTRKGIGVALQAGISFILKEYKTDIIIIMSGNGKDQPAEIKRLIKPIALNNVDYVQGSRFLPGGSSINLFGPRILINRVLPILWSFILQKRITEVTNGYRAFNTKIFENGELNWNRPDLKGYEWEYYINYHIIKNGFTHTEVPVSKHYVRGVYHSKIRIKDGIGILKPLLFCPLNLM